LKSDRAAPVRRATPPVSGAVPVSYVLAAGLNDLANARQGGVGRNTYTEILLAPTAPSASVVGGRRSTFRNFDAVALQLGQDCTAE
jgi:hypothetical protein